VGITSNLAVLGQHSEAEDRPVVGDKRMAVQSGRNPAQSTWYPHSGQPVPPITSVALAAMQQLLKPAQPQQGSPLADLPLLETLRPSPAARLGGR